MQPRFWLARLTCGLAVLLLAFEPPVLTAQEKQPAKDQPKKSETRTDNPTADSKPKKEKPAKSAVAQEPVKKVAGAELKEWAKDLKSPQEVVRCRAVLMIGQFDQGSDKWLIQALKDKSPAVRFWAADQLGEGQFQAAKGVLDKHLEDPSPSVRLAAAFALARLGDLKVSLPILEKGLQGDRATACFAGDFLARIGPPAKDALPALEEAVKHKDYHVEGAALRAMKLIDPQKYDK